MDVFGRVFREKLRYDYGNRDFEHVRCAAHVLNLSVSEGMKIVVNSITKLRNFASYIRKSQPLFEDLKRIFQANGRPFLVPDLDVPTRWNSTYIMIEKMFRIREITDDLVEDNPVLKDRYLSDNEWNEISVSI